MRKLLILIFLVPGIAMSADKCEKEWKLFYEKSSNFSQEELLRQWDQKKDVCGGSWIFDYRKGYILFSLGKYAEVKTIVQKAKGNYTDNSPFEFLSVLVKKFGSANNGDVLSKEKTSEIDKDLTALNGKLISTYPEYQSEVAVTKLALGRVDDAIKYANQGLKSGDEWPLLRTLALSYEAKKDYESVRKTIDRLAAVSQETYVKSIELLLLSARAYAATERMDLAKIAIVQASEVSPQDMDDPDIQLTIQFIKSKIASGEFKNQ